MSKDGLPIAGMGSYTKSNIELFARQKIAGWDVIGYGIDGTSIQDKIKIHKADT